MNDIEVTEESLRAKIVDLEDTMKAMEGQIHMEPTHLFAHKLYSREITIPKGVTFTGKTHKFSHITVIRKGDITVLTDQGMERLKAPYIMVCKAGTKRAGFAHEETIWTTFHHCEHTDIQKVEDALVCDRYEDYLLSCQPQPLLEEK